MSEPAQTPETIIQTPETMAWAAAGRVLRVLSDRGGWHGFWCEVDAECRKDIRREMALAILNTADPDPDSDSDTDSDSDMESNTDP